MPHLNQHLDAGDPLEWKQQEGHKGKALTLGKLLETCHDYGKLGVLLPGREGRRASWVTTNWKQNTGPVPASAFYCTIAESHAVCFQKGDQPWRIWRNL